MKKFLSLIFLLVFIAGNLSFAQEIEKLLQIKVTPAKPTPLKKTAFAWIDASGPDLAALNDEIWRFAEVAMEEYRSAEALASFLEKMGFQVERGVAGLPTAFVGTYGSGEPVVGILAGVIPARQAAKLDAVEALRK